jgi:hypothetical protein
MRDGHHSRVGVAELSEALQAALWVSVAATVLATVMSPFVFWYL